MSALTKVFFPGLNGLRFLAAFAVLVTHVELTKKLLGHGEGLWIDASTRFSGTALSAIVNGEIRWLSPFISAAGPHGVVFFFVLSGFLITYLLLQEKKVTGTIAIRKFYIRRILRIWPLYYFIVFLGFFVLPYLAWWHIEKQETFFMEHFYTNLICYLFLLPNLAIAIFNRAVPNIGQSWSIGVEEQFYIIWPLLLKFFSNAWRVMMGFLLLVLIIKTVFMLLSENKSEFMQMVSRLLATTKIESMAIGGLGAYLLFHSKEKFISIIFNQWVQWAAYFSVPCVVLLLPTFLSNIAHLIYSVAFLIIILNVAANPHSLITLRGRIADYLGKISYGFYMYHMLCITFSIYLLDAIFGFAQKLEWWQTVLVYILSLVLSIIISSLSYELLEKRFIRRKKKYTTVISGDDAKE